MVRSSTRSSLAVIFLLLFQLHHIFFEPVVALLPFGAAIHEPLLSGAQHTGFELAGTHAALLLASDQAARLARVEVRDHRRRAHLERLRELADRSRSAGKPSKHSAPGRVCKSLEGAI